MRSVIRIGLLLLLLASSAYSQGVSISPGHDYTLNILGLDYIGPSPEPGYVPEVKIVFTNDILVYGEQLVVNLYENSNPSSPVSNYNLSPNAGQSIQSFTVVQFNPPLPYPNEPAFVRFSILSGSVDLYSFSITEETYPGQVYSDTFVVMPPSLGLQLSAGQPTLTITGIVGTVYSIQYADDLSPASHWTDRTLLQVQGTSVTWSDPSTPTPGQRFYRAVSAPVPADRDLVFIQPGTFTMGSPTNEALRNSDETQHIVTISQGFWMKKYLVTQDEYMSVVSTNPSFFNGFQTNWPAPTGGTNYGTDGSRPVETVSWFDATNYCALWTQQARTAGLIPTNYAYRLPTESEWEYVDRAGTTTAFYLGCGLSSGKANFDGQYEYDCSLGQTNNPSGIYLQMTTPVGSYAANPWGLSDMIGNVWEWCQDCYGTYPTGSVTDPQGPAAGSGRVLRGGYWGWYAQSCRSAQRNFRNPTAPSNYGIGFRVLLAPAQPETARTLR
jgi:formylglycine-generating enzyme required for sulfatase activity